MDPAGDLASQLDWVGILVEGLTAKHDLGDIKVTLAAILIFYHLFGGRKMLPECGWASHLPFAPSVA